MFNKKKRRQNIAKLFIINCEVTGAHRQITKLISFRLNLNVWFPVDLNSL